MIATNSHRLPHLCSKRRGRTPQHLLSMVLTVCSLALHAAETDLASKPLSNSTAAEVTSNDSVDTDNTGFVVNQVAASNINVNAATYIFLAIA